MSLEFHIGNSEAELDTKSPDAFRTISEVAEDLDIPQHVLRFWETRFPQIKPLKRGGGRRYYRPDDVALLKGIRRLLYGEGYTIKGLQRILKEQGPRHVQAIGRGAPIAAAPAPDGPAAMDVATMAVDIGHAGEAPPWRPQPASAMSQHPRQPPAGRDEVAALEAVLAELTECQRVLRGVLQPQAVSEGV